MIITIFFKRHYKFVDLYPLMFSVEVKATSASLSPRAHGPANLALDGTVGTEAHGACRFNTDLWFKINFDSTYCFSEIVIVNKPSSYATRMEDTRVYVVNTDEGSESLCGVLKVRRVWSFEGQTYRIPCHQKCGDEVKLKLRHDHGQYSMPGCIHIREINAYAGL